MNLEFQDFLSIFLKGFVKDVIVGIAMTVENIQKDEGTSDEDK